MSIYTHTCVCCVLSSSTMSESLHPRGLQPARLLSPWDFPGQNTGVGCRLLLQGLFSTQGLNLCLLSVQKRHLGSPYTHTHISSLHMCIFCFLILFHYHLLQDLEYSSVYYRGPPCYLSVLQWMSANPKFLIYPSPHPALSE